MLKQLVELAKAKKQVNIAFTYLTAEKFILGIAPANAGSDKIAPFLAKGSVEEIETQLAGLDAFITAALAKKPEPAKADDVDEDDGDTEETDTTDTARCQKGDDSGSRCLLDKDHAGKCKFTPNKTGEVKLLERKCRVCHTLWTDDENGNWPESELCAYCAAQSTAPTQVEPPPAVEPAPEAPAVPKQPTFNF